MLFRSTRYLGEDTEDLKFCQEINIAKAFLTFTDALKQIIRLPKFVHLTDDKGRFLGFEQMKALSEAGNATDEGYVVMDWETIDPETMSFTRTKVKNSAYVALHHLRSSIDGEDDGISYHKILNLLFKGEQDEFLSVLPQYKEIFHTIDIPYQAFVKYMDETTTTEDFQ